MKRKVKIIEELKKLVETKVIVAPEEYEKVADKLDNDDVVKIVDEVNNEVLSNFIKQYGEKKGKEIYYATANKQNRDPETFHKESIDDEDYEQASREVEFGTSPEKDEEKWELTNDKDMLDYNIKEEDGENNPIGDNSGGDRLKADVERFIKKLKLGQFKNTISKIDTPIEQAEVISAFAEVIGVPRSRLPIIIKHIKNQAESVRPKMKKSDLIETVLKIKKKNK